MQTAKRLEGIGEYYFSQKLREIDELNRQGKQIINLGIGSPDLPPHPDVIRALHEESQVASQHAYQSYKGSPVLRNAIAAWYKRCYGVELNADNEILPLIGSKEGIMHICMTYVNEGDIVLVPDPGYPTYNSAARIAGGRVVPYTLTAENNWYPDLDGIAVQLKEEDPVAGKIMFVSYPHMPTGQLPTKELFASLVDFAKKHNILLVHDNPYSFILNDDPMSILSVDGALDVAIELNSLSKSHNMAGWRVGMLCASKQRVDEVLRFKSNMDSGMFLPVQLAAAKALSLPEQWNRELNTIYRERRNKVFELLDMLGCDYDPSQAGLFVWAAVPDRYNDGYALSDEILYKANVFITPGGIFGKAGLNYVRISLCSSEQKFQEAINRVARAGAIHEQAVK